MLTIRIVGSGFPNCENLFQLCKIVAAENKLDVEIQKITDKDKFTELGVWMTPALIVDGQILSQGKIPTKSTLEHWLKKELAH
jgi:small redox-active disulfide protein 2